MVVSNDVIKGTLKVNDNLFALSDDSKLSLNDGTGPLLC